MLKTINFRTKERGGISGTNIPMKIILSHLILEQRERATCFISGSQILVTLRPDRLPSKSEEGGDVWCAGGVFWGLLLLLFLFPFKLYPRCFQQLSVSSAAQQLSSVSSY